MKKYVEAIYFPRVRRRGIIAGCSSGGNTGLAYQAEDKENRGVLHVRKSLVCRKLATGGKKGQSVRPKGSIIR